MHLIVLQLVLYFAGFCDTGIIQWFQAQRQVAEWAPNSPNVVEQLRPFEKGYALPTESAATYRRKGNSSHAKTRILFVDYLGVTWSFSPRTASWATITTTPSAEDALSRLRKKTITNLCGTKVVAFGGYQEESDASDPQNVLSNKTKTALFNGETEEWQFFVTKKVLLTAMVTKRSRITASKARANARSRCLYTADMTRLTIKHTSRTFGSFGV